MTQEVERLVIRLDPGPDADAHDLERWTRQLREVLDGLDVEKVEAAAAGPAPEGSKGVAAALLGTLVVTLLKSGVVTKLIDALKDWLLRHKDNPSITVERNGKKLVVTGLNDQETLQVFHEWLKADGGEG